MPAIPSSSLLATLVSQNLTASSGIANTTSTGLQVVCAFPVSGQYGPGSRVLYYMLFAACVVGRKPEWLRTACLAAVLLFSGVAALHGIVLASLHVDGAVDMDVYGAFQLCAIGILATPITVKLSRLSFNSPGRTAVFVWTALILAGLLSLTVEFFRLNTHACPFDESGNPISANVGNFPYENPPTCNLTCSIHQGPFSPIRSGSANGIYVIPAPTRITFGTGRILAAACCIPAIISLVSMWNKMLEINWRSRFGNRDIDVRAMIEGTNGATEKSLTRVNKYIRRLLNVVEVSIYGVAVLLIFILGELNFFSTQVRHQTEPMSSVGQWAPLVGTGLAALGSLYVIRAAGPNSSVREKSIPDASFHRDNAFRNGDSSDSMQERSIDLFTTPSDPSSTPEVQHCRSLPRHGTSDEMVRHQPTLTMTVASTLLSISGRLSGRDYPTDDSFRRGSAVAYPVIPAESQRNQALSQIEKLYNPVSKADEKVASEVSRQKPRSDSSTGSTESELGIESDWRTGRAALSSSPTTNRRPRASTSSVEATASMPQTQNTISHTVASTGDIDLTPNITSSNAASAGMSSVDFITSAENPCVYPNVPQLHLLSDKALDLERGGWKQLLPLLPEIIRWDIEYKSYGVHCSCWTFTPSTEISPTDTPLTIAGAPVVIPVDYQYPLMGLVAPPLDPFPRAIDPGAVLDMSTIATIFQTFEHALGFFLLLNGMLQIFVPEDFDYEWASSHRPNVFGGLKVCYIGESFTPTAKLVDNLAPEHVSLPQMQSDSNTENKLPLRPALRSSRTLQPSQGAVATSLRIGSLVDARPKDSKNKVRYAGRIGVKTRNNGMTYMTVSSHVITSALAASEQAKFYRKWLNSSQSRLDSDWFHKVEIYSNDIKVGNVSETFDPRPEEYPRGFPHDVSVVGPLDDELTSGLTSPVPNLGWLSQEGWHNLRRYPANLHILGDAIPREAKSIPSFGPSQCLVVGEGIFLNRSRRPGSNNKRIFESRKQKASDSELATWTELVSRSILYRVAPDFEAAGGQSGAALYSMETREDGKDGPGVLGFQSFVQMSGHVQTYEMEGEQLNHRLKKGLVSFYGAFQVPRKLREEHHIM